MKRRNIVILSAVTVFFMLNSSFECTIFNKEGTITPCFTVKPSKGDLSTVFTFSAACTTIDDDVVTCTGWNYWWTFGDGKNGHSTVETITHQYDASGEFRVSLDSITCNNGGNFEGPYVDYVTVEDPTANEAPEADFNFTPDHGTTETVFNFDASYSTDKETDDDMLEVRWDWDGDGTWDTEFSTEKTATYKYAENGDYEVKLEVQDEQQLTDTKIKTLNISDCINGGEPCAGKKTVVYEGKTYNTVQIGYQCWMKENLNLGTFIESHIPQTDNHEVQKYCYENIEANCEIYGGIYIWNEMMEYTNNPGVSDICPDGWHVPTSDEWDELAEILGGYEMAGQKMKSCTDEWNTSSGIINTNESGFNALPGGKWDHNDHFLSKGNSAHWWTSNENTYYTNYAFYRGVNYIGNSLIGFEDIGGGDFKSYGMSVRCIQNPQ